MVNFKRSNYLIGLIIMGFKENDKTARDSVDNRGKMFIVHDLPCRSTE